MNETNEVFFRLLAVDDLRYTMVNGQPSRMNLQSKVKNLTNFTGSCLTFIRALPVET